MAPRAKLFTALSSHRWRSAVGAHSAERLMYYCIPKCWITETLPTTKLNMGLLMECRVERIKNVHVIIPFRFFSS